MAQGVEIGRWYDPETDCWFTIYKFSAKEFDEYLQEENKIDETIFYPKNNGIVSKSGTSGISVKKKKNTVVATSEEEILVETDGKCIKCKSRLYFSEGRRQWLCKGCREWYDSDELKVAENEIEYDAKEHMEAYP